MNSMNLLRKLYYVFSFFESEIYKFIERTFSKTAVQKILQPT